MKFGLTLPSFTWPGLDYQTTRRITKEMARRAEELGFDSLTVWDHLLSAPGLYGGSWLDPLIAAEHFTTLRTSCNGVVFLPSRRPFLRLSLSCFCA